MADQTTVELLREEIKKLRVGKFMECVALSPRNDEDYKERPELLKLDFSWAVVTALCTAETFGIDLDIEDAIQAAKDLLSRPPDGQ